jgi:hypothetical protein
MDMNFNAGRTYERFAGSMGTGMGFQCPKITYQDPGGLKSNSASQFSAWCSESVGDHRVIGRDLYRTTANVVPARPMAYDAGFVLKLDGPIYVCDVLGNPGNRLEYDAARQISSLYETLAYWTPAGPYAASGAYLETLQGAYSNLAALEAAQFYELKNWLVDSIEEWSPRLGGFDLAFDLAGFNLEQTIRLISQIGPINEYEAETRPFHVIYALRRLVKTRQLKTRITLRIRVTRKALRQSLARFCGLSWMRRLWFLMHGSHPPKPESWSAKCQEFGCA